MGLREPKCTHGAVRGYCSKCVEMGNVSEDDARLAVDGQFRNGIRVQHKQYKHKKKVGPFQIEWGGDG